MVEIRKGERWRCQNPECRSEIFVTASSLVPDGCNPLCSCGEIMKKPFVRPELMTYESAGEALRKFGESSS